MEKTFTLTFNLGEKTPREELNYGEYDDLKNLAGNIAKAKNNCNNIIEKLEKEDCSPELISKYEGIKEKVDELYLELGEELRKYNLV